MTSNKNQPPLRRTKRWLRASLGAVALGVMMASGAAHAGFQNGGFEDGNLDNWTTKRYKRGSTSGSYSNAGLDVFPPTRFDELKLYELTGSTVIGGAASGHNSNAVFLRTGPSESLVDDTGCNTANCFGGTNTAPNLKLPRWGQNAVRVGGYGGFSASSIEQTATMTVADIDPVDGKIHVRFALAPILNDPSHDPERQPYFFVEVVNETKGTQLFNTFNFSNQSGIPWQKNANYGYTDWQGFDVAPGNGLLDVGDEVTLRVYVSNCADGGANHTAVVYLDAVGAFMPGLAVQATGPSSTQPGNDITYAYNYTNNSGVFALGTKMQISTPFTEDGKQLTFEGPIPSVCAGPTDHDPVSRGQYITCDVGDLANNQSGSLDVKFKVPGDATTTAPQNVINNGDYNIYADSVSPYLGPLVKTNMPPLGGGNLVDLGVTIGNGGKTSFSGGEPETYIVTVTNHGDSETSGTVTQTITGMGNNCAALSIVPSGATCDADGSGVKITFPTGDLAPNGTTSYTVTGMPTGSPVNTIAKVAVDTPDVDNNLSNNTAGMNTPMGGQHQLTVNAAGNGSGNVLSTEPTLKCGDNTDACTTTGVTQPVTDSQEVRFTPVPHTGSMFTGWDNCVAPGAELQGDICVVKDLNADKTVTAKFAPFVVVTPKIDPANPGGSIDQGPTQVEKGTTTPPAFTITPDPGKFPKVIGSSDTCKGSMTGPDVSGKYSYTPKTPVDDDCEFTVTFGDPQPEMEVELKLPGPITVGKPYTDGELTCTNIGTATAHNVTCTVTDLPPGLTLGACVMTPPGTAFTQPGSVDVSAVVSCPITGTPTGGPGTPTGETTWTPGTDPANPNSDQTGANGEGPGTDVPVAVPPAAPVPVDNPFALLLLALGLLGLGSRYARKRNAA